MDIMEQYFNWLCAKAIPDWKIRLSFSKVLNRLNNIEFTYSVPMDENRMIDGVNLRYRFGHENNIPDYVVSNTVDIICCTVLEMMVALAIRMEEEIFFDPKFGDRTSQWFMHMLESTGLLYYSDDNVSNPIEYIEFGIDSKILIMLNRSYDNYGNGSLFRLKRPVPNYNCLELWNQMICYANELEGESR